MTRIYVSLALCNDGFTPLSWSTSGMDKYISVCFSIRTLVQFSQIDVRHLGNFVWHDVKQFRLLTMVPETVLLVGGNGVLFCHLVSSLFSSFGHCVCFESWWSVHITNNMCCLVCNGIGTFTSYESPEMKSENVFGLFDGSAWTKGKPSMIIPSASGSWSGSVMDFSSMEVRWDFWQL